MTIERYELDHGRGWEPMPSMMPTRSAYDGDWVRYEDHAAALARSEEERGRLREALYLNHLALSRLGCRIQNDHGTWKVRKPHDDMPVIMDIANRALAAYHATIGTTPNDTAPEGSETKA